MLFCSNLNNQNSCKILEILGDYWNMACMVNVVHLKEKTSKDVDKDPNEKRDKYDTHLETET